jgi:hypothetical protein
MKSGEYLVFYFLLSLPKIISNLNANKLTFNAAYETDLPENIFDNLNFERVIQYMKDNGIDNSEIVELYYYRVLSNLKPENELYYFNFKELLIKNMHSFSSEEVYWTLQLLETYCIRKVNEGDGKFLNELFEIFNEEISKGII